jgi:glycosyltransferase involved in cell wall biosynthesis
MKPKISIITPTKNSAATLEASILSVINQDCDCYEYILVDGGSLDDTLPIIRKYGHAISHWTSGPDNGIYDAMRKGIEQAQGEYIYFLGSDDLLCPGILQKLVPLLKEPQSVYYGNAFLSVTRDVYDGPFNRFKIIYDNICQQAIFYPASVYEDYQFNEKYPVGADYELNLRLFLNSAYSFEYVPFIIAKFSQTGISATLVDRDLDSDKRLIIRQNASLVVLVFFYLTYYVPGVRFCSEKILGVFQNIQEMRSRKKYFK